MRPWLPQPIVPYGGPHAPACVDRGLFGVFGGGTTHKRYLRKEPCTGRPGERYIVNNGVG